MVGPNGFMALSSKYDLAFVGDPWSSSGARSSGHFRVSAMHVLAMRANVELTPAPVIDRTQRGDVGDAGARTAPRTRFTDNTR